MSHTLVIVESPAKCSKIEKILGSGYKCIASYGHIRELNGLASINIENNFTPNFSMIESKRFQISKIKKAITDSKEVLLAADDDREGEAIAWHICQSFKLPISTTKRIIFHEITEGAIKNAVKTPTLLNMDVVHAQQARQILDLLVGYKISPILWSQISGKSGLSAGRCQSPALRLIYDNQKNIDASPGRKVYNTVGYFTSKNLQFSLNYNHDSEDKVGNFLENSASYSHIYDCSQPRNTTKNQPKPFTTSTLQQSASNELRISPKITMQACQKLYEEGYITYMRTDSTTYSKEFLNVADKFIKKTYGDKYVREDLASLSERTDNKKKKKSKKEKENTAQEAHEAIRPTNIATLKVNEELGSRECRIYQLIRRNTLESCMAPATYKAITATISAPEKHEYKCSSEQIVFAGWKKVAGGDDKSDVYNFLLTLKKQQEIPYKKIVSKVSMKDLKTHYTEAKLVQLLEQNGIGRPSTFSSLVDKIQERGYVKKDNVKGKSIKCVDFELTEDELVETENMREFGNEKGKLVIQPLGLLVIEFLIDKFDSLFEYKYTKQMEDTLDIIAKGEKIWYNLCKECLEQITELSKGLVRDKFEIPIDKDHTYIIGKYGPVLKCNLGGKTTFKNVKKDIDLDKLKNGEYSLEELIIAKQKNGRELGMYENKNVILKTGKFGPYVEWSDIKKSVTFDKEYDEVELSDIISQLKTSVSTGIKRVISEEISIRNGKYGDYIFHKKGGWKKPKFIKLKDFTTEDGSTDYNTCTIPEIKKWLKDKHNIS